MGRLPESFGGRKITTRIPWEMRAQVLVPRASAPSSMVETRLVHNSGMAFEIHRMIPRAQTTIVAGGISVPNGTDAIGMFTIGMTLEDMTRQQPLTKQFTPLTNLCKGDEELTWEWADPFYLEPSEGFIAAFGDVRTAAAQPASVELVFEGFLLVRESSNIRIGG